MWCSWYILIDLPGSVLGLIKANSAVQQNACVGRSLFWYMTVLYRYIKIVQNVNELYEKWNELKEDKMITDSTQENVNNGKITWCIYILHGTENEKAC